jgi:hypothetical protein
MTELSDERQVPLMKRREGAVTWIGHADLVSTPPDEQPRLFWGHNSGKYGGLRTHTLCPWAQIEALGHFW